MKILITGAAGGVGRVVSTYFVAQPDFDVRLTYHRTPIELDADAVRGCSWTELRMDVGDYAEVETACEGREGVIHLAADPRVHAPWESVLRNNIIGMYHLLEACRSKGVRRIAFASTNHVIGMYEEELRARLDALPKPRLPEDELVTHDMPIRPDSYYGASKAFGEALGRYYVENHGLEFVSLRIGSFRPEPGSRRELTTWISHDDMCHQFERALLAEGIDFCIAAGASDNDRKIWSLGSARRELGYAPRDNAEEWAARLLDKADDA